ncbi:hypothetical protein TSUD_381100 [Trifolium subterraneum]|uniref:DUF3444 domain-containing protein n=1 Tax=Trifolium subterraneum TaxID=3900 RepID=A0A2Z6MDT9_TRISU|nr:hypothetical protein TSUD_381100 [Trifolium subterraneum]
MDCNKEEALRAKSIAEKKMESKDFIGARTIALKAQKLYPDLENIAQLLVVCDVHCSAEQKLLGNAKVVDWTVLNRSLRCQQCNKPFIAYEVDPQSTKSATNSSQNQQPVQQNNKPNHGAFKFGVESQGDVFAKRPKKESHHKKGSTSNVSVKPNGKRKRKNVVESSESSIGSTDSEDDTLSNDNGFPDVPTSRDERPRRSTRQKHQVSYKENGSDNEHNEEIEMNDQNGLAAGRNDGQKEAKQKQKIYSEESSGNIDVKIKEVGEKETVGSSKIDEASEQSDSKSSDHLDDFVYPDPEFSDFDKDKKEECFASGQIWAAYDDIDAMPRFYAIIKKVFSPGFKLQITWLEADPNDKDECKWIEEKLPNACGKYKLGTTVTTKNQQMFSHQTLCEKFDRTTFKVYPRKGETWALFKNWDIKWYMDAKSHQKYDFEFVEILSDYVEGAGVIVAYLAKLKGFVSLYSRVTEGRNCSFQIPPAELFRFSHRVPSFKMTGKERAGVPVGSYELDPISLPMEEVAATDDVEVMVESTAKVNLDRSNLVEKKKDPVDHIDDVSAPSASAADSFEVPDPSFYQFDDVRSHEKFEAGQIWAFYGDEDELPRYYGQIKEVRRIDSTIELQVIYLTDCWLSNKVVRWDDKDMIISCGRFKVKPNGKLCTYNNTNSVSHQVHANVVGRNKNYEIFPRKGEIWALYRGWTTKLKRSDLKNCEYDIVEVTEDGYSWTDVLFLEKVSGYSSVFKCKLSNAGKKMNMTIDRTELLRFSHQIPAFKLTAEHDSNLKGFWELDPSAMPVHYLR